MSFSRGRIPGIPIQGPPGEKGDKGNTGNPGALRPLGAWSIGTTYNTGDSVSYGSFSYASMIDNNEANQPDVSPTEWQKLLDLPTMDLIPNAVSTVNLAGQKISNAANATASGDLLPKGQADATYAAMATPNVYSSTNTFRNNTALNFSSGSTPKFPIPTNSDLVKVDQYGNFLVGLNYLLSSGTPSTLQNQIVDFGYLQNNPRMLSQSGRFACVNDPPDMTFVRFGPSGGSPWGGGVGTTSAVANSPTVVITNAAVPAALANFVVGQIVVGDNITAIIPPGTTILSTNGGPVGNTITLTLSNPINASLGATFYSIARNGDLTGNGSGTAIGQVKAVPVVAPYLGDETTPGGLALSSAAMMEFVTFEVARNITDPADGVQNVAQATAIRFYTTKVNRGTSDRVLQISAAGNLQVGMDALTAGDTGDVVQIRGSIGQNTVMTIVASGNPTAGTYIIKAIPDSPSNGYPTPLPTAAIAWNAPATGAGSIQTALNALAAPFGSGQIVAAGGPLPGTPVTLTFSGSLVQNHAYRAFGIDSSGLTGGSYKASTTTVGLSSDSTQRGLFIRASAPKTVDYITVVSDTTANILSLTSTGVLSVPAGLSSATLAANPTVKNDTHANRLTASVFAGYLWRESDRGFVYMGSAGGNWIPWKREGTIIKTSDQTVTNNTLTSDNDLHFPIEPNEVIAVELVLFMTSASLNADWLVGWAFPTGCAIEWGIMALPNAFAGASDLALINTTASGFQTPRTQASTASFSASGGKQIQRITALVTNAANAGTITFQWAQNTTTAENNTINKSSFMRLVNLT